MKNLLIYGPKQRSRQEILLKELSTYFDADGKRLNAMIFAPTHRKATELRSQILVHFEGRCWMPEVMTFPRFMENHYGEVLGDRQLLSPYARLLVINHLLREGQFGYLEKAQPSYGLSQKISEALGHLQASLLVDEERNELIQQLTAESPEKSKTVELLDQAYHRFLAEHRLADENVLNVELLLKWQRDGYPGSLRPPLIKGEQFAKVLVLDEFAFFTELEKAVFHALVPSFEKIILTLAAPSEDWRDFKTHKAYESVRSIVDWLGVYDWEERKASSEPDNLTDMVAERLFLNQPSARIPADVGERDFRLIATPNRREEMRTIARLIRQSLPAPNEGKIIADLREFVVVCPDLTIYKSLIEEVFGEYRLPVKISRGYPLQQIPFIALLKKILTCVSTERWTRADLFDIFSSGWIDFTPEIGVDEIAGLTTEYVLTDFSPEAFDIHRIDRLALAAGVPDDFSLNSWFGKIKSYLERDDLRKIPPFDREGVYAEEEGEQIIQSNDRAQVAFDLLTMQKFIQRARILTRAQSAFEFRDALGQFMELMSEFRMTDVGNEFSHYFQTAYLQLIQIINEMVKTFRALGNTGGHSAQDYIEYITMAIASTELSEEEVQPFAERENENAVQVISPLETGGLSFENLFIVGLVEGEYPGRPTANFLISPDESEPLPLATLDPLPQKRFLFQQMIGNAQRVVLTYPKMADGKELAPSPFVEDIRTLFDFPQDDRADEIAPLNDSEKTTLFSEQEVLKRMGELNNIAGSEHLRIPHANLQTQLKMEQAREQLDNFSIYDGHLHDNGSRKEHAAKIRQKYESSDFFYSVSQLDDYAQCPMKFFFKYILALEDLEEAESEISPDAKGRLAHKILERFGDIQKREELEIEEAHAVMPIIAQDEARRYEGQFGDLYWEEEKRMLISRLTKPDEPKGILKAFLEAEFEPEKEFLNGNFRPTYFEYHFGGFQEERPQSFALEIPRAKDKPPIRIRGRIDRVDIDEENQRFAVYDYKTGGYANIGKIEKGISFQLPIYLQAVARQWLTKRENPKTPAAGAYYVLKRVKEVGKKGYLGVWDALKDEYKYKKDGGIKKPPSGFYFEEDFRRLEEFVIENIKSIDECIRSGKFNPSIWEEKDALCQWCKYKFICRYNASRQLNMKARDGHYHPKRFVV